MLAIKHMCVQMSEKVLQMFFLPWNGSILTGLQYLQPQVDLLCLYICELEGVCVVVLVFKGFPHLIFIIHGAKKTHEQIFVL